MKRLRISKLMDEYTDTEFFPAGGSAVDPEAVKERVLAQAKASAPAKKKQMPRKKKVLLAAAMAAAMVLLMAAGYPYIRYQLAGGTLSFEQGNKENFIVHVSGEAVKYEDGRLIFTPNNGQRIDITDLVSEETPYIYDGSDPDTELEYYIIMGGTPECYGWLTWIKTPNLHYGGADEREMITAYHFYLMDHELDGQVGNIGLDVDAVVWWDRMDHSWLLAGAEQIGITFVPREEFEAMVEAGTQ